jgi:hypothetical protein
MRAYRASRAAVDSTRELWLALSEAVTSPSKTQPKLLAACATQASLAKYTSDDGKIRSYSLNALKVAADDAVEIGGWSAIEALRKQAYLHALPIQTASNKARRGTGYRLDQANKTISFLDERIQQLLRSRVTLLSAYTDIIEILRTNRHLDPKLEAQLKQHESTFAVRRLFDVGATSDA